MELIQVLQSYSIIGLQVFGEVKHMKTSFSLLAYVNRFVITYNTINIYAKKKNTFPSAVSTPSSTDSCPRIFGEVSPRPCVGVISRFGVKIQPEGPMRKGNE